MRKRLARQLRRWADRAAPAPPHPFPFRLRFTVPLDAPGAPLLTGDQLTYRLDDPGQFAMELRFAAPRQIVVQGGDGLEIVGGVDGIVQMFKRKVPR